MKFQASIFFRRLDKEYQTILFVGGPQCDSRSHKGIQNNCITSLKTKIGRIIYDLKEGYFVKDVTALNGFDGYQATNRVSPFKELKSLIESFFCPREISMWVPSVITCSTI